MPIYLARIHVRDELDDEELAGMADALGAHAPSTERPIVLEVPGEAPDLTTAVLAATGHAAEILDGYDYEVEVRESS